MTNEIGEIRVKFNQAVRNLPSGIEQGPAIFHFKMNLMKMVSLAGDKVVFATRFTNILEHFRGEQYRDVAPNILKLILGWVPEVEYVLDPEGIHFKAEIEAERERKKQSETQRQAKRQLAWEERLSELRGESRLPEAIFSTHRLQDFEVVNGNEKAYAAVLDYLGLDSNLSILDDSTRDSLFNHHFLTLCGETGRGKTHLAIGMAIHEILERQLPAQYWQVEEFLDALRFSFSTKSGERCQKILNQARLIKLLVLDDLGAQQTTEWAMAKLDAVIDYRYIHNMRTIFTTNIYYSGFYFRFYLISYFSTRDLL